jgi:UDP-glucose 4-epimerase
MGGELGTRVANLLEADSAVDAIVGIDIDPPRRRLTRAEFHRVDPRNRVRTAGIVRDFAPTALLHLGTYEPNARSSPKAAIERTAASTIATITAAVEGGSLDRIVVRSGIEVYGRRRGAPSRPDEDVRPDPTTPWGHSLLHAELLAAEAGLAAAAPVTLLRFAPVVGPHFPSPLGRLLRLPVVPVSGVSHPRFSLLHQEDAAAAIHAALLSPYDGPVNVVGAGSVTALHAARLGGRVPWPVVGPGWRAARALAELAGAPVPAHIHELLLRGRNADGSQAFARIGFAPTHRTRDVVRHLHEWAEVTYLTVPDDTAA